VTLRAQLQAFNGIGIQVSDQQLRNRLILSRGASDFLWASYSSQADFLTRGQACSGRHSARSSHGVGLRPTCQTAFP
jgi:hypothetical protein